MKKLFFLIAFLSSVAVSAQNQLQLVNNSSMDIEFRIHKNDASCSYVGFDVYVVAAGFSATATAATGDEYVFADFSSSGCTGFSGTLGTPTTPGCNSNCTFAGSSSYYGSTGGCGLANGIVRWNDCGPGIGGAIEVFDF